MPYKHLASRRRRYRKRRRTDRAWVRRLRAYHRKNPGKVALWHKRWRRSPAGRRWYRKNRARRRGQQKKYYRRERRLKLEQQRSRRRRYYWKNRDRILANRRSLWARSPK